MQPQRVALLFLMILCVVDLVSGALIRTRRAYLKILIKAECLPQLAECVVRYLLWEMALIRGLPVSIVLEADCSDDESKAIRSIMIDQGLVEEDDGTQADLVFSI